MVAGNGLDPFEGVADEHLCFFDPPRLPEGRWEKLLERAPWLEPENPDWRGQPGANRPRRKTISSSVI